MVPAGVTAYRKGLFKLQAYDQASAAETLAILEEYSYRCREEYGRSIVYPSDEWYLTAGRELPAQNSMMTLRSWKMAWACGGSITIPSWKNWKTTPAWYCPTAWMW